MFSKGDRVHTSFGPGRVISSDTVKYDGKESWPVQLDKPLEIQQWDGAWVGVWQILLSCNDMMLV